MLSESKPSQCNMDGLHTGRLLERLVQASAAAAAAVQGSHLCEVTSTLCEEAWQPLPRSGPSAVPPCQHTTDLLLQHALSFSADRCQSLLVQLASFTPVEQPADAADFVDISGVELDAEGDAFGAEEELAFVPSQLLEAFRAEEPHLFVSLCSGRGSSCMQTMPAEIRRFFVRHWHELEPEHRVTAWRKCATTVGRAAQAANVEKAPVAGGDQHVEVNAGAVKVPDGED